MTSGEHKSPLLRCLSAALVLSLLPYKAGLTEAAKNKPCNTCKDIAKNVHEGIKKTAKSNFGGGNTNWEEKSLGKYAFSETRLLEILEEACPNKGSECHSMLEEYEDEIEKWWFKYYAKGKSKDFHRYFCIHKLEVCCPEGTHGPECKECQGGKERPCKDNGKCHGDGTREGTGQCECDAGYQGSLCDECKDMYYEEDKNDTHTICKACHSACKTSCFEAGPEGCEDCKDGWEFEEDKGCIDQDECSAEETPCKEDEYCVNNPGSYRCTACDRSCDECSGPGPTNCKECAEKYYRLDQTCKACHVSCDTLCTDDTPKTCDACSDGWIISDDHECVDVNECESTHPDDSDCDDDEYCVNTIGSYKCSTCHYSCNGCTGPGADHCKACEEGYAEKDSYCTDIDECDFEGTCPGDNTRCINTPGAYKCDCEIGYKLAEDGNCQLKPKDSATKTSTKSSSSRKNSSSDKPSKKDKKNGSSKSKKKSKKKDKLNNAYGQFWLSLVCLAIGGIIFKSSVFAQFVFVATFWLYLFWFSQRFDKL